MIKIERHNLDSIAGGYYSELSKKGFIRKEGNEIHEYWYEHKRRIITSLNLEGIIEEFKKLDQSGFEEFKIYMNAQYTAMRKIIGYWLLDKLNVRVCPYCNRQYTFTIEDKKVSPQFDHFYPKSKYPFLALSFYNLIPSCYTCNHKKDDEIIEINPYTEGFGDKYKFQLKTKNEVIVDSVVKNGLDWILRNDLEIDFTAQNKNIDEMALKELYNEHTDYAKEIIDKVQAYNNDYYSALIESYHLLGKQKSEIDTLIWGNYIDTASHENRPLSKLTRDILDQLGIGG